MMATVIKPKKAAKKDWKGLDRYWVDGILWSEKEITSSLRIEKSHILLFGNKVPTWINNWLKKFG